MFAVCVANMGMETISASINAGLGCFDNLINGDGEGWVIRFGAPRPVGRDHDLGKISNDLIWHQERTLSSAIWILETISSIWVSSMMNGGASKIWSPLPPSMVPPMG